jgi:serine/threonine-protein kinase
MQISKLLFGEIALKKQLVTKDQVEECLEIQKRLKEMGITKTLGAIMHDKKYLSMVEIKEILREMTGQKDWNAIEGYEIVGKLGKGGMGSVYKARHTRLNKFVALKVLPPELAGDQEYLDRFMREAHAAAKLNHQNIVQALDVGESYGYHYFVMEYVDGVTVKDMIDQNGTVAEHTSLDIMVQVAEALEHAWKNEIVHRDIKPSNIIIAAGNVAKLCDLGLAKTVDDDATITQTGVIMGTPFYLSPEQARSESLDCRSDLYSLGVTLFHMLTGQVPFTGNSAATILYKHIFLDSPNPKSLNPTLHDETVRVLRKMLAKRKEDRHADPAELAEDLRQTLSLVDPEGAEAERADRSAATEALMAERHARDTKLSRAQTSGRVDLPEEHEPAAEEAPEGIDDLAAAKQKVAEQEKRKHAMPARSRLRVITALVSGAGLVAAAALVAANLLLTVEPPRADAAVDPMNVLATSSPRDAVTEAVKNARALQAEHRYADAVEALARVPDGSPLRPTELVLLVRTREAIIEAARARVAELERRHQAGEDVLTEVQALNLPAVVDRLERHRAWLSAQQPTGRD